MKLAGSAPAWVPLSTKWGGAQRRGSLGIASASFTQRMRAERRGGAEKPLSDPFHLLECQGRSKFGPLRRSKSRPVGEGVAVFVGRLERSLRSPFRAAQA